MKTRRMPESPNVLDRRKTYSHYKEDRQDVQRSGPQKGDYDLENADNVFYTPPSKGGYKEDPAALARRLEIGQDYNNRIRSGKGGKYKTDRLDKR